GLPRRASTTFTCAPFGLSPPQPSPTRPSSSSSVTRAAPRAAIPSNRVLLGIRSRGARKVEDDADRLAGAHQLEGGADLLERQRVRDEPVERQPPAPVEVERERE